jgi:N-terminal domain on NACHT_NTPase and P-loop NTPases/NB-ARC domain
MAEAAAIIGLVSSIASLVELSAKVVSRLHDYTSKTSEIPESFRSLLIRLPLLTVTLQRIQTQAEAGRLPNDVTNVLKAVVDNTSEQVLAVQTRLSKILPLDSASKLERAVNALKSLAQEDKVQQALEKIHKNNDILVLYQTTRHVDTGDRILEELSKLSVAPPASAKLFGVCLGQAPQIAPDAFIGRTDELQQLQDWLLPKSNPNRQRIVSIVSMGGMGKTQLSLAHVRNCADKYSSVFWMNAKDETSLVQSIVQLSAVIFRESPTPAAQTTDEEKLKVRKVQRWLSEPGNDQWLCIFDNYDDPRLPGINSSTGYDIRGYFPQRAQGSILITTRSPRLSFTKQLRLKKLVDVEQSLAILAIGSGRKVDGGKLKIYDNKA